MVEPQESLRHVPLGVSGLITVPRADYLARGGVEADVLKDDEARANYIALRLAAALEHPVTHPGSEQIALSALALFPSAAEILVAFAEKALETLRDGQFHSRLAVSPGPPSVAVSFTAWSGTHREVQPERYGRYLGPLVSVGTRLVEQGVELYGLLEVDAYVREGVDPAQPEIPRDEVFEVDVEFSFLPGMLFGFPAESENPLSPLVLLNTDLCSAEERQLLEKLNA